MKSVTSQSYIVFTKNGLENESRKVKYLECSKQQNGSLNRKK